MREAKGRPALRQPPQLFKPRSVLIRFSGLSFRLDFLDHLTGSAIQVEFTFFDRVISRNLEERSIWFAAADVGQPVNSIARAWIEVFAHHDGLQLRRIPALVHR